jgi:TolA-binding protein
MHLRWAVLVLVAWCGTAGAVSGPDAQRLADGLFARGMYELALREYQTLADQPALTNREMVLYRLAESLRGLGRAEQADAAYARVVAEFPASRYARRAALRQAEAAFQAGRWEDVVRVLSERPEAEVEADGRAAWRYFLAHAERQRGRGAQAEPLYRRLLKSDGDSPYAPFARLELAELVQARQPDAPEIRTLLQEVVQAGATNAAGRQAALQLAGHLYDQKDFAASARAYAELMRLQPGLTATVRVAAAWSSFKAGLWTEARELASTGTDADSLYVTAHSLRQLQRTDEAARAYARLIEQYPPHALAAAGRYEAAALALARRDFATARTLAAAVTPTPELAEDLGWIQAEAARELGEAENAVRWYDQVVRDHATGEKAAAARFHAARLTQELGRWEEAAQRYRAVADDARSRALAPEALYAAAYARLQVEQRVEAVKDWARLQKEYPDFPRLDEVLLARAHAEIKLDRIAAARETLETLTSKFPRSAQAAEGHYLLGTLLEGDEKWEAAEYHYRLAARGRTGDELVRRIEFRRVAVLQRQGRNDEAAAALNHLLAQPEGGQDVPPPLLDWLARWNLQQQQWPEAEKAALALTGRGPAWDVSAWYQVGRARDESGRLDEARVAYRKAALPAGGREAIESAYRLGRLSAQAGDLVEARRFLMQAAEAASDSDLAALRARSYLALAGVEEKEGKADEALRTLLSVALLYDDPELTPEALHRASELLGRAGRAAEAAQTRQELLERYPDSPWAQRARSP